jgi:hypothetical protein
VDGNKLVLAGYDPVSYQVFDLSALATRGTATLAGSVARGGCWLDLTSI